MSMAIIETLRLVDEGVDWWSANGLEDMDDSAIDSPGWVHILLGMSGAAEKVWWWVIECRLHMQRDCITLLLNPPQPQTK
jgi:hypothetical protein